MNFKESLDSLIEKSQKIGVDLHDVVIECRSASNIAEYYINCMISDENEEDRPELENWSDFFKGSTPYHIDDWRRMRRPIDAARETARVQQWRDYLCEAAAEAAVRG